MDDKDRALLTALQADARLPLKALAERVGLSSPSVAERLQRLQERGVIRGFTIDIDAHMLGYGLQALVHIRPHTGMLKATLAALKKMPEVVSCDSITGDDCYAARVVARSMPHLDSLLTALSDLGETRTSVVKAQVIPHRGPPLSVAHGPADN